MTMYEESLLLLAKKQQELNPQNYNIVYMGDSWVGEKSYTSNEIFNSAMEEALKHNPLLVVHGGDLVYNGEQSNFDFFINFKNEIAPDLPFFVAVGNHDMDKQLTGDAAVANFKEQIGPLHFTLNIPRFNFTLISLDALNNHEYSNYGLNESELQYLSDNLLHRYQNTLVAMHVPPRTNRWVPEPGDDTYFTLGSNNFFEEVEDQILAALVSHIHAFKTTKYKHTSLFLSGGGGAALLKKEIFHILVINIQTKSHGKSSKVSFSVVPIGRV